MTLALPGPLVLGQQVEPSNVPRLDWSHVKRAYRQVERWVAGRDGTGPPIHVTGLSGARVTLRHLGRRLGVGESVLSDDSHADLNEVVREATDLALLNASDKLRERRHQDNDEDRPMMAGLGALLTVDLQVALEPEPILLPSDAGRGEIYRNFSPGYHGLRMSMPKAQAPADFAWSWPASNLAANFSPEDQISHLLRQLRISRDHGEVAKPRGPKLERFAVIHFTKAGPNQPAQQLVRGNLLLPPAPLGERTIEAMGRRLASHLMRRQRDDGSYSGTFEPTSDRLQKLAAPDDQVALAAFALSRHANIQKTGDESAEQAGPSEADRSAVRAVSFLTPRLLDPTSPAQPTAMALTIMTVLDSPYLNSHSKHRDAMLTRLLSLRDQEGVFLREKAGRPLDVTSQAIIVAALTDLYARTREKSLGLAIDSVLDQIWPRIAERPVIGSVPWLAAAQFRFHPLRSSRDEAHSERHRQRLATLSRIIQLLQRRQIADPPSVGPPDILGGFELAAHSAAAPDPDWKSSQALLLLARALRYPPLILAQDRTRWALRSATAARFLAQLMFDEPSCYYVRSPSRVLGGVRKNLHDNTLDITATAMTLLAIGELRQSLAGLAQVDPGR